jgi:hypothetical protein
LPARIPTLLCYTNLLAGANLSDAAEGRVKP